MHELLDWAKKDYGIDMMPPLGHKLTATNCIIENEVDFIFKVKLKYMKKKNYEVASKI